MHTLLLHIPVIKLKAGYVCWRGGGWKERKGEKENLFNVRKAEQVALTELARVF